MWRSTCRATVPVYDVDPGRGRRTSGRPAFRPAISGGVLARFLHLAAITLHITMRRGRNSHTSGGLLQGRGPALRDAVGRGRGVPPRKGAGLRWPSSPSSIMHRQFTLGEKVLASRRDAVLSRPAGIEAATGRVARVGNFAAAGKLWPLAAMVATLRRQDPVSRSSYCVGCNFSTRIKESPDPGWDFPVNRLVARSVRRPQIQWNLLDVRAGSRLLAASTTGVAYFVHSYALLSARNGCHLDYGGRWPPWRRAPSGHPVPPREVVVGRSRHTGQFVKASSEMTFSPPST